MHRRVPIYSGVLIRYVYRSERVPFRFRVVWMIRYTKRRVPATNSSRIVVRFVNNEYDRTPISFSPVDSARSSVGSLGAPGQVVQTGRFPYGFRIRSIHGAPGGIRPEPNFPRPDPNPFFRPRTPLTPAEILL